MLATCVHWECYICCDDCSLPATAISLPMGCFIPLRKYDCCMSGQDPSCRKGLSMSGKHHQASKDWQLSVGKDCSRHSPEKLRKVEQRITIASCWNSADVPYYLQSHGCSSRMKPCRLETFPRLVPTMEDKNNVDRGTCASSTSTG